MPTPAFSIFPADDAWRVVSPSAVDDVRVDREAPPAQVAAAVAAALHARGYRAEGVLLALPSAWCLAATVSTADLPRQDRAALAFRLEEKLPLAAEQFTADFVPLDDDTALGVCAPNDKVLPVVDALESAGVVVQSIAPAALVALDATLPPTTARPSLVLWGEGGGVNVLAVHHRRPAAWALSATPAELRLHVDLMALELGDVAVVAHAVPPEFLDVLPGGVDRLVDDRDLAAAAASRAPAVLSGDGSWVELRRGALAAHDALRVVRRPVNAALAAAAVFLLALTAVFLYRGHRYDRLARDADAQLVDEFKRAFPDFPVPPNPRATIEAERRKVLAAGSSALPPEAQESALRVLHAVLSTIPPDAAAAVALDAVTFNDTSLQLEGRAKTNEAVDAVVAAARASGMDVPPPVLQKTADNLWSFVVRGTKPAPPPRPGAAAAARGLPRNLELGTRN